MRRLLILSVVAAAIWVLAVWLPGEKQESQTPGVDGAPVTIPDGKSAEAGPWIDFSDGAVDRVVIVQPGGNMTLYKEAGEWFVNTEDSQPVRAKRGQAEALTAFLRGHPPVRRLEAAPEDLGSYGLDNATRGISVYADGEAFTLVLGDLNPTGDGIYAVANGPAPAAGHDVFSPAASEILLVDTSFASRLAGGADRFYDLRALAMNREALASIRLEGPESAKRSTRWEIAFDQDNATQASFTWPEDLKDKPVSLMEADSYATRLIGLEGKRFYEPADAKTIEQEPAFDIYVRRRGSEIPEHLAFSIHKPADADPLDAGNATFVVESDWQTRPIVVAAKDVDALLRTAFSMRERDITHFTASQVKRMEAAYVQPGGKDLNATAVLEDDGWQRTVSGKKRELPKLGMSVWQLADLAYADEPRSALPPEARKFLTMRLYGDGLAEDGLEIAWYKSPHGVDTFVNVDNKAGPYYPVGESGRRLAEILIDQLFDEAGPATPGDALQQAAGLSATSP